MKIFDMLVVGIFLVVGAWIITGSSNVPSNPFSKDTVDGKWKGGNNMSGGDMRIPSNIG